MNEENFQNADITRKIIGAAMKVHRTVGNGFQEVIYQRCLAIEFEKLDLRFDREKEQTIFYKIIKKKGNCGAVDKSREGSY